MGGVVSGLFGGGSPSVVTYEAEQAPREPEQEAVASGVRDEERRKLSKRRLMGGTILSSPLGQSGVVSSTGSSLLGRIE